MSEELVVRELIEIKAPVSKVWDALTNLSYTKKYMFALNVESDWRPGSPVIWTGDAGGIKTNREGKILKIGPGKFLRISDFNPSTRVEDIDANYGHITQGRKAAGGTTVLSVITDHLNGDESRRKDSQGFWDRVLPELKMVLESQSE